MVAFSDFHSVETFEELEIWTKLLESFWLEALSSTLEELLSTLEELDTELLFAEELLDSEELDAPCVPAQAV